MTAIGSRTIQFVIDVFDLVFFIATVLRRGFWFLLHYKQNTLIKRALVREIIFDGVDTLLSTILVLSVIIGFSITAQLIIILQNLGSETAVINIFIRYVALELSPLMTSIIIICRSGSATAIELGNMSINREIKGLELLGIDMLVYYAFPSLLGKAASQIALSCYFSVLSVTLGVFFSAIFGSTANLKFFSILLDSIEPIELFYFLIKNMLFGMLISANACFQGLRVKNSVTEVPQRAQKAIMHGMLSVFLINALFVL